MESSPCDAYVRDSRPRVGAGGPAPAAPRGNRAHGTGLPKDHAVVSIDAQERVQVSVLVGAMGDMTKRLREPTARGDSLFGHGTEFWSVDELGTKLTTGQLIP